MTSQVYRGIQQGDDVARPVVPGITNSGIPGIILRGTVPLGTADPGTLDLILAGTAQAVSPVDAEGLVDAEIPSATAVMAVEAEGLSDPVVAAVEEVLAADPEGFVDALVVTPDAKPNDKLGLLDAAPPFITDTFTRADGALGVTETGGKTWTSLAFSEVVSDTFGLVGSGGSPGGAYVDSGYSANVYVEAVIVNPTNVGAVILGLSSLAANDAMGTFLNYGPAWVLQNDVGTSIASYTPVPAAGDRIRLATDGTDLYAFINGNLFGTLPVTGHGSVTTHGVGGAVVVGTSLLDEFSVGQLTVVADVAVVKVETEGLVDASVAGVEEVIAAEAEGLVDATSVDPGAVVVEAEGLVDAEIEEIAVGQTDPEGLVDSAEGAVGGAFVDLEDLGDALIVDPGVVVVDVGGGADAANGDVTMTTVDLEGMVDVVESAGGLEVGEGLGSVDVVEADAAVSPAPEVVKLMDARAAFIYDQFARVDAGDLGTSDSGHAWSLGAFGHGVTSGVAARQGGISAFDWMDAGPVRRSNSTGGFEVGLTWKVTTSAMLYFQLCQADQTDVFSESPIAILVGVIGTDYYAGLTWDDMGLLVSYGPSPVASHAGGLRLMAQVRPDLNEVEFFVDGVSQGIMTAVPDRMFVDDFVMVYNYVPLLSSGDPLFDDFYISNMESGALAVGAAHVEVDIEGLDDDQLFGQDQLVSDPEGATDVVVVDVEARLVEALGLVDIIAAVFDVGMVDPLDLLDDIAAAVSSFLHYPYTSTNEILGRSQVVDVQTYTVDGDVVGRVQMVSVAGRYLSIEITKHEITVTDVDSPYGRDNA